VLVWCGKQFNALDQIHHAPFFDICGFYYNCSCWIFLRLTAKTTLPNELQLLLVNDGSLWLSNPSTQKVDFGPAELCGFGQGTLNDKPVSQGLRKHNTNFYIGHVPGCFLKLSFFK